MEERGEGGERRENVFAPYHMNGVGAVLFHASVTYRSANDLKVTCSVTMLGCPSFEILSSIL